MSSPHNPSPDPAGDPLDLPLAERRRRRRELWLAAFVVAAIAFGVVLERRVEVTQALPFGPGVPFFFLNALNVILIVLLVYLVARNFVKLVFERRRGILGAHLNLKFVTAFILVATVPTAVLFFVCIGVYSVNNNAVEIWIVIAFAIVGYGMRLLDFPAAPLILGFVLGPMMEIQFRRTLIFSGGDFAAFVNRPISVVLLALSAALLVWTVWSTLAGGRRAPIPGTA